MRASRTLFCLTPLCALLAAGSAYATNGYFSHGYGIKAKGMGGASVAMAQDGFAGANNPAAATWAGNRAEAGLDFFMPSRG
ncbi:MAG: long-chain fatty acid transporter, partial [Burkholderiaceae bacterium]|nr:long-chain fatty acid transporter [Burkholderiaceae bacterium]